MPSSNEQTNAEEGKKQAVAILWVGHPLQPQVVNQPEPEVPERQQHKRPSKHGVRSAPVLRSGSTTECRERGLTAVLCWRLCLHDLTADFLKAETLKYYKRTTDYGLPDYGLIKLLKSQLSETLKF